MLRLKEETATSITLEIIEDKDFEPDEYECILYKGDDERIIIKTPSVIREYTLNKQKHPTTHKILQKFQKIKNFVFSKGINWKLVGMTPKEKTLKITWYSSYTKEVQAFLNGGYAKTFYTNGAIKGLDKFMSRQFGADLELVSYDSYSDGKNVCVFTLN